MVEYSIQVLQIYFSTGRSIDVRTVHLRYLRVKKIKSATIDSIVKKDKSKQRPQALNTVELLRICSAKLGIGPAQAMSVAERLYTQGN